MERKVIYDRRNSLASHRDSSTIIFDICSLGFVGASAESKKANTFDFKRVSQAKSQTFCNEVETMLPEPTVQKPLTTSNITRPKLEPLFKTRDSFLLHWDLLLQLLEFVFIPRNNTIFIN